MKTIKQAKWGYIICSLLFCVLGIYVIVNPLTSAQIICLTAGVISVIYGLTKIIGYFSYDMYRLAFQFDLALGIFVIAVGIILILHPGRVISFLPMLIGIFVLTDGVFKLQTSFDAKLFGMTEWWLILLGALLCILIGIFLMVDSLKSAEAFMTVMGIAILIDGIQNMFNAFYTIKILNGDKKDIWVTDKGEND